MTSPRRFPSPRNDAQSASLSGLAGWRFLAFLSANRPSGADAHYGPGATRTISVEDLGPQGGSPLPLQFGHGTKNTLPRLWASYYEERVKSHE